MSEASPKRTAVSMARLQWDTPASGTVLTTLELTEAIIVAHQAALRDGDGVALMLLEPLLRHAGHRLSTTFSQSEFGRPAVRRDTKGRMSN